MKQRWKASEDPLDCRGVAQGNGSEWEENTDCLFADKNVYRFIHIFYLLFLCVELNYQVMVTFFGGRQSWGSQNPIVVVPAMSWEKEGV